MPNRKKPAKRAKQVKDLKPSTPSPEQTEQVKGGYTAYTSRDLQMLANVYKTKLGTQTNIISNLK